MCKYIFGIKRKKTCLATTSLSTFTIQYGSLVPELKMMSTKKINRFTELFNRSLLHANILKERGHLGN